MTNPFGAPRHSARWLAMILAAAIGFGPVWARAANGGVALSSYASLGDADAAAVACECQLIIDDDVTLAANTTLKARTVRGAGGIITRGAYSVTINGAFSADGQVFDRTGAGRVTFAGGVSGDEIEAVWFGVHPNDPDDDSDALVAAINAAGAVTTAGQPRNYIVKLPAGDTTVTRSILLKNPRWDSYYTLVGAGRESSRLVGDFYASALGPSITLANTGGGTGAVLVPIIDNGQLSAVLVPPGGTGTGYDGSTTATLTLASGGSGSGATIGLTISAGVITAASVLTPGSGYNSRTSGDVLVVAGQGVKVRGLTIAASANRAAATNGGIRAYPYDTINNGLTVLGTSSFNLSIPNVTIEDVGVTRQPGDGVLIVRGEQVRLRDVLALTNGSDGVVLHDDRMLQGIANELTSVRSVQNGYRGISIYGMLNTTATGLVSLRNLTAGARPSGVVDEVYSTGRGTTLIGPDIERVEGASGNFNLLRLSGSAHVVLGGYFNGGLRQIYLSAASSALIKNTQHYGHPGDTTPTGLFFDGGTVLAETGGQIGGASTFVTNLFSAERAYVAPVGLQAGVLRVGAVRGGQYATTQSTTFTPALTNGSDQTLILSGNANIAAPSTGDPHGMELNLTLVQNGTGGYTPTFNAKYVLVDSIGAGAANQIMVLKFKCVVTGARTVWIQTNPGEAWK